MGLAGLGFCGLCFGVLMGGRLGSALLGISRVRFRLLPGLAFCPEDRRDQARRAVFQRAWLDTNEALHPHVRTACCAVPPQICVWPGRRYGAMPHIKSIFRGTNRIPTPRTRAVTICCAHDLSFLQSYDACAHMHSHMHRGLGRTDRCCVG
jgi:hypothetical protein